MVYSMDWFMYPTVVGLLLCPIIIIYFYLPFFRRLNITTAFEYLELRFNLPVRLYGSAQFILFSTGTDQHYSLFARDRSLYYYWNQYLCLHSFNGIAQYFLHRPGRDRSRGMD